MKEENELLIHQMGEKTNVEIGMIQRRLLQIESTLHNTSQLEEETKQALIEAHGKKEENKNLKESKEIKNGNDDNDENNSIQEKENKPWNTTQKRSLLENRSNREEKLKLITIQKAQAEHQGSIISMKEMEVERLRKEMMLSNTKMVKVSSLLTSLSEKKENVNQRMVQQEIDIDTFSLEEKKAKALKTLHMSEMASLEEEMKRCQLKVDMKHAIEERRRASGLTQKKKKKKKKKNDNSDSEDDDDDDEDDDDGKEKTVDDHETDGMKKKKEEEEKSVEENLAHIQKLMSDARQAWEAAETRCTSFHGLLLQRKKERTQDRKDVKEMEKRMKEKENERDALEESDMGLSAAKKNLVDLVAEEKKIWTEISIEETSVEIIGVQVAEQVKEKEEESAKAEALKKAKESGAEVEIEVITLADGTFNNQMHNNK